MFLVFILGILLGGLGVWFATGHYKHRFRQAVEDRQLLEQEKQIVLEFMHNMVEAVGDGASRTELFNRIVHAAVLSTGALSACIFERTGGNTLRGAAMEGLFPPQRRISKKASKAAATRSGYIEWALKSSELQMGEGIIGDVAKTREAVLIEDATTDPRVVQHEDPALAVRSLIVSPIIFRDELLGVLAVANRNDGLSFNRTDVSLVVSLAEHVGLAIHNSRMLSIQLEKNRLDLDLELASNIQGLLLPSTFPASEKIDFAAIYRPAQKVGGDLFDVFALSDNRIGMAIADVSGKGISGSIPMAICQTNLRHCAKALSSPAAVLNEVNSVMYDSMRSDMFITIIYAIIDLNEDTLTFARAGHELPLIIRGSDDDEPKIIQVSGEGMAIGLAPEAIFSEVIKDQCIPFRPLDTLILYTDGVTETTNRWEEEYSTERLIKVLEGLNRRTAQKIVEGVLESVERFGDGCRQIDDITFLVAKYR